MEMKKLLTILLTLTLVFVFTACGDNGADSTDYSEVYDSLVGQYQDSVSQRAVASIERTDDGCHMIVSWGNSAFEFVVWEMNLAYDGEKLTYTDCKTSVVTYEGTDEEATESEEVISENGEGYFLLEDGVLAWEGAQDINCQECRFEKFDF